MFCEGVEKGAAATGERGRGGIAEGTAPRLSFYTLWVTVSYSHRKVVAIRESSDHN
jgi:hypothetical protein